MESKIFECRFGSCQPKCLGKVSYKAAFAVLFAIVGVVQGSVFTAFVGSITTLEKRYAFGSKVTGIINLADNISPILLSIVIAYFASRGHRTRWCGACIALSGISAILFAVPYFIFGSGQELMEGTIGMSDSRNSSGKYQLCGSANQDCTNVDPNTKNTQTIPAVSILFLANFISGIGSCGYYVIGAPLADDTVKNLHSPIYFGVVYSFRLAGPTIGFLISSRFLKYYEDPSYHPSYGNRDPRWVGAWWLSFVSIGLFLTCLGLLMMLFPRKVYDGDKKKANVVEKTPSKSEEKVGKVKEITATVKLLVRNPILIFYNLGLACQLLATVGYFVFLPKYLENEFHLSPSQSNRISGLAGILVMMLGFLGSGIVLYKFKPRPRYVIGWKIFAIILSAIGLLSVAFIGCDSTKVVGTSRCSTTCGCDLHLYSPVCHKPTNRVFFSPCHAGCSDDAVRNGSAKIFEDCTCAAQNGVEDEEIFPETLTMGTCDSNCNSLMYFIVVLCLIKFFSSSGQIGSFLVMLRSVPPHEKSVALSLNSTFICAFAMIPYPLVYGALVDSCCAIWETTCSGTGHCWVYDTDEFRIKLHAVSSGLFFLSAFFNVFTCYYSKSIKNMYGEAEEKPPNYSDNSFVADKGMSNSAYEMEGHEGEAVR